MAADFGEPTPPPPPPPKLKVRSRLADSVPAVEELHGPDRHAAVEHRHAQHAADGACRPLAGKVAGMSQPPGGPAGSPPTDGKGPRGSAPLPGSRGPTAFHWRGRGDRWDTPADSSLGTGTAAVIPEARRVEGGGGAAAECGWEGANANQCTDASQADHGPGRGWRTRPAGG